MGKNRLVKIIGLGVFCLSLLLCGAATAKAADASWILTAENESVSYFLDKNNVVVMDDGSIDFWAKFYHKQAIGGTVVPAGSYDIAHYAVKKDYSFRLLERSFYSADGTQQGPSFMTKKEAWEAPTSEGSPLGTVAKWMFARQSNDPQLTLSDYSPADVVRMKDAKPSRSIPTSEPMTAVRIDEMALGWKNAQENGQIRGEKDKRYYVQDTQTIYYFLERNHMTAEFALSGVGGGKYMRQLRFVLSDSRSGEHHLGGGLSLFVDGVEWKMGQALQSTATGTTVAEFTRVYGLTDRVVEALCNAKDKVEVQWRYGRGNELKEFKYAINPKVLTDMKAMYQAAK